MAKSPNNSAVVLRPINQIAALKLRKAGIAANGEVQPVFQLMKWGLECDPRRRYEDIAYPLAILSAIGEATATDYLLEKIPGGVRQLLAALLRAEPLAASRTLLGVLDMRLKSEPYSPSGSHPNLPHPQATPPE